MSSAWQANYDEALVPSYELPDLLLGADGTRIEDAAAWEARRRPELLELFREHMFGRMPGRPEGMHWRILDDAPALGGLARRRQIRVFLTAAEAQPYFDLLLYLPAEGDQPAPAFLGLNFRGNQSIHADPAILIHENWVRNDEQCGITENRATEASRGSRARRWPVERILARGYALATIYYGDIDPDYDHGFTKGVQPLFREMGIAETDLGSISAWSWGLSRALDYLETDGGIDGERVAVMGHSRLGKTALWAGASDPRFSLVVSNNSGCGGAAISRRRFGETVARINRSFPHWFCAKFKEYSDREDALPFDQHGLIALAAPRPAYVASAEGDRWADPKGEFLATYHAGPAYELYGRKGPETAAPPPLHQPVGGHLRYHVREGGHDVTEYDWDRFLDLADWALPGK